MCLSWRLIRLVGDWLRGGSSSSMIALFQRFAAYETQRLPVELPVMTFQVISFSMNPLYCIETWIPIQLLHCYTMRLKSPLI